VFCDNIQPLSSECGIGSTCTSNYKRTSNYKKKKKRHEFIKSIDWT
jgi:hypothetical protein